MDFNAQIKARVLLAHTAQCGSKGLKSLAHSMDMCIGMGPDMCIDMCVDMCVDICIGMRVDLRIDM